MSIATGWSPRYLGHWMFQQEEKWVTADGREKLVTEMDDSHLLHTALMLEGLSDEIHREVGYGGFRTEDHREWLNKQPLYQAMKREIIGRMASNEGELVEIAATERGVAARHLDRALRAEADRDKARVRAAEFEAREGALLAEIKKGREFRPEYLAYATDFELLAEVKRRREIEGSELGVPTDEKVIATVKERGLADDCIFYATSDALARELGLRFGEGR